MSILKYIKLHPFIKTFLPHIKSVAYKTRGTNSRGNPASFSPQEQAEIIAEIEKLLEQSKNKYYMKRYWLFAGEHYYPSGGMMDFRGSFDTMEEAEQFPLCTNW